MFATIEKKVWPSVILEKVRENSGNNIGKKSFALMNCNGISKHSVRTFVSGDLFEINKPACHDKSNSAFP